MPEIYSYDFDSNPKPWNENNKQDMDKYFNYGFTEETWRYHCREMQVRALLAQQLSQRADLQNHNRDQYKRNSQLNFVLPH